MARALAGDDDQGVIGLTVTTKTLPRYHIVKSMS